MSGHVLVVDAVATNRIALKVKLFSAFYETSQADTAEMAMIEAKANPPSAVLLGDVSDTDMAELVNRFRRDPATSHLPLLVLLNRRCADDRLRILRAGADDVISKPFDDMVLLARLRSAQRAREADTELGLREATHRALGLAEAPAQFAKRGGITFISCDQPPDEIMRAASDASQHVSRFTTPRAIMSGVFDQNAATQTDVFVLHLSGGANSHIGQQIVPELRTRSETRHAAVIVLASDTARRDAATLLDLGANDLVRSCDVSVEELVWRLDQLVAQKQKSDRLRATTQAGLQAAVTDPLTGLYNRRYALPHLTRLIDKAQRSGRGFAVMIADIDHFKAINDNFGHASGDLVLRGVATRLRDQLRAADIVARLGGEEFLIILPDMSRHAAMATAQRMRGLIGEKPFCPQTDSQGFEANPFNQTQDQGHEIAATISIGVAVFDPQSIDGALASPTQMTDAILRDADAALYEAKAQGRNKVELFQEAA